MRWLPAFDFHGGEARFPLCAGTALHLLHVVNVPSVADVSVAFAAGLLVDPLACLWLSHQVAADREVSSVRQLIAWLSPAQLRALLASGVPEDTVSPSSATMRRARRCAMGAAIRIAQSVPTMRRARDSRMILDILLQSATRFARAGNDRAGPWVASDAISADAGDAEGLALLEETSAFGRTLARQLHRAWTEPPFDPQQMLGVAVANWSRLTALEQHFDRELATAKLSALKELAYGASHEINNPIANIAARAQVLLKDETSAHRKRALTVIHQQALRAHQMIADLMLFAKPPALRTERFRVCELVADTLQEANRDAVARGATLTVRQRTSPSLGWIDGDRLQLGLALRAICLNAIEAMGSRGTLTILAAACRDERGVPELRLRIRDSGPGIPPDILPHIFDPFFSGREAGRGLGFGLSRAWRIVAEHGGQILARSDGRHGAAITIHLPRHMPRRIGCEAA